MCHGQIIFDRVQRAQKKHQCGECRRQIEPGRLYRTQGGRDGGDHYFLKLCKRCATSAELDAEESDGCFALGGLRDAMKEAANWSGWKSVRADLRRIRDRLFKN